MLVSPGRTFHHGSGPQPPRPAHPRPRHAAPPGHAGRGLAAAAHRTGHLQGTFLPGAAACSRQTRASRAHRSRADVLQGYPLRRACRQRPTGERHWHERARLEHPSARRGAVRGKAGHESWTRDASARGRRITRLLGKTSEGIRCRGDENPPGRRVGAAAGGRERLGIRGMQKAALRRRPRVGALPRCSRQGGYGCRRRAAASSQGQVPRRAITLPGRKGSSQSSEVFSTARKADWGSSTSPTIFIRFLPSFCFSRSFRLREMSPP